MDKIDAGFSKIRAHLAESDRLMSLLSANGEPLLVIANARTELRLANDLLKQFSENKSDRREEPIDG